SRELLVLLGVGQEVSLFEAAEAIGEVLGKAAHSWWAPRLSLSSRRSRVVPFGSRGTQSPVANIRVFNPLAQKPVSWHFAADNKSVRIKNAEGQGLRRRAAAF